MYRCEICGIVTPPGAKALTVVVEKRERTYPTRVRANKARKGRRTVFTDCPGGKGWEIAKEALACKECLPKEES